MSLKEAKKTTSVNRPYIFLKNIDKFEKVFWSDISFIESQKNYLLIHASQTIYRHRATIKEFIKNIPNKNFVQVHRAFIVNIDKIKSYKKSTMELEIDGIKIPISKSYKGFIANFLES